MEKEDLYTLEFARASEGAEGAHDRGTEQLGPIANCKVDEIYKLDFSSVEIGTAHIGEAAIRTSVKFDGEISLRQEMAAKSRGSMSKELTNNELSKESLALAQWAIEVAVAATPSKYLSIAQLSKTAFSDAPPLGTQGREFKQALKQNRMLDYLGNGQFGISERLTPETYWPGQSSGVDIITLADSVAVIMQKARPRIFSPSNIMGIVKSQNVYLDPEEVNLLFARLSSHEFVKPRPNGTYIVEKIEEADETSIDVTSGDGRPSLPMGPKQIRKALKAIDGTPEMRRTKDLAKNYADPRKNKPKKRRRQGGRRMQGRTHGKKVAFERLVADIDRQTS